MQQKKLDKSGFVDYLRRLPLPAQGSNRGYPPEQLFLIFMSGLWCGIERYSHLDITRLDSGFYSKAIFSYLEDRDKKIDYITAVPMYVNIQRRLAGLRTWLKIENGIEIAEFEYQAQDWDTPRRMITVRQKIATKPRAVGKQLSLFEDDIEINGYRYTCYITSLTLSAPDVWRLYRQQANCENRIKELKYDYGLDKMNQHCFDDTEATLLLMTIAYDFLSLFKQVIIGGDVRNQLKTLRHKMLVIPAIIENHNNKTIVKLALHINRRNWIDKLCYRIVNWKFG